MQQNAPLVTVGIPTYNRPEGLEKTLQCILGQTYRNLEVIVSDNCSPGNEVKAILEKYEAADNRVKYFIQEKNLSIIPNFQILLDQAKGEYFMWAADDDNWEANFIEVCVEAMVSDPSVILSMTDMDLIFDGGHSRPAKLNRSFMQKGLFARSFSFVKSTAENKYFFCGLYRTALVKNIPLDNSWGGDQLFVYEAVTKGRLMYIPGKSKFYYYRGGSSKGMDTVRKAFNIKNRYYFFEKYILKFATHQFGFKHLGFFQKLGLFFTNSLALVFNEDFMLYYIFIKLPIKRLISKFKKKPA